jgi:hypothetical protein
MQLLVHFLSSAVLAQTRVNPGRLHPSTHDWLPAEQCPAAGDVPSIAHGHRQKPHVRTAGFSDKTVLDRRFFSTYRVLASLATRWRDKAGRFARVRACSCRSPVHCYISMQASAKAARARRSRSALDPRPCWPGQVKRSRAQQRHPS